MATSRTLACGADRAHEAAIDAMEQTAGIERIVTDGEEIWGITGYTRAFGVLPTIGSVVIVRIGDEADPPDWDGLDEDEDSPVRGRSFSSLDAEEDDDAEEERADKPSEQARERAERLGTDIESGENPETTLYVTDEQLAAHQYKTTVVSLAPSRPYYERYLAELETATGTLEQYDGDDDPLQPAAYPLPESVEYLALKRELPIWFLSLVVFTVGVGITALPLIGFLLGSFYRFLSIE